MKKSADVSVRIVKAAGPVKKAELSTAVNTEYDDGAGFIAPAVELNGLKVLVNNSSILPQCIRAYKNNIAGFGIGVRYTTDEEETPEMKAEWDKITEVLEFLNMDQDTKEVFEDVIEARETYGIAYLEVIRNLSGEVTGIEFIRNTPSVAKTAPILPYVDVEYEINGKTQTRKKKFCKYRQMLNGKTVYFKEIGDPRIMDLRNGEYSSAENSVPIEYQANELLEFAIGVETYGEVRWLGTALNVDGSRKAENLNNRYFAEGRHTPLMLLLNGGTLTDKSFSELQTYMDDIKGENGQHAFIILESENTENRTDMEAESKPDLQVVKLADILQKDELFQDYLNNNRRKVQSAFQLPDLYVGYTTDFNRATAQSAQEVTEKQVFQPERQSLAWIINHKLLADYHFKYVEAYFLEPDITNPDDMTKILNITERAGGLTPNKAKEITYKLFNDPMENYEGDWGDTPLAYSKTQQPSYGGGFDQGNSQQVQKSAERDDIELMSVMKEIRQILIKNSENGENPFTFSENRAIIKEGWSEDAHPRDERGRFTSGGASPGGSESNSGAPVSGTEAAKDHVIHGASAKTQEIYDRARANEKLITPVMTEIAAELGCEMTGLEYSVKTASSVADKLERKAAEGVPEEKAISKMNDLVRYTQLGAHNDLVANAASTKGMLEARGFEITEVDNKWLKQDAVYKGIHMTVKSPEGQSFELQFHSSESMAVKNENHKMYEESRKVGTSNARRAELESKMKSNTSSMPNPAGVEQLQNYRKEG